MKDDEMNVRSPANSISDHVGKHTGNSNPSFSGVGGPVVRVLADHGSDQGVASDHADSSVDQERSSAHSVERKQGGDSGDQLGDIHRSRQGELHAVVHSKAGEELWAVVAEEAKKKGGNCFFFLRNQSTKTEKQGPVELNYSHKSIYTTELLKHHN